MWRPQPFCFQLQTTPLSSEGWHRKSAAAFMLCSHIFHESPDCEQIKPLIALRTFKFQSPKFRLAAQTQLPDKQVVSCHPLSGKSHLAWNCDVPEPTTIKLLTIWGISDLHGSKILMFQQFQVSITRKMVQNTTEETGSVVKGGNATAGVISKRLSCTKSMDLYYVPSGQIPVITLLSKIGVPVRILLCTIMTVKVILIWHMCVKI